jgi:hypothetical protein
LHGHKGSQSLQRWGGIRHKHARLICIVHLARQESVNQKMTNAVNDSCIPWTWFQAECRFAALWPTHCSAIELIMDFKRDKNQITLTGLARPQYLHPPHPHSQTVWHSQCLRRAHTACSQGASISFKAKNQRHTLITSGNVKSLYRRFGAMSTEWVSSSMCRLGTLYWPERIFASTATSSYAPAIAYTGAPRAYVPSRNRGKSPCRTSPAYKHGDNY